MTLNRMLLLHLLLLLLLAGAAAAFCLHGFRTKAAS